MAVPCEPANAVAKKINDSCETHFAANRTDCNKFLKAALADFLAEGYFDGLDADRIVGRLQTQSEGWTRINAITTAIDMAKSGNVVVARMTSTSLGQSHGHVAVVVGCDGQESQGTTVPLCYAGSIGSADAQVAGGRLSQTFLAASVWSEKIDYYFRLPDRTPP